MKEVILWQHLLKVQQARQDFLHYRGATEKKSVKSQSTVVK
jgi:hypothetical protein